MTLRKLIEELKVDFRSVPYNRPKTVCEAVGP